MSSRFIHLHTHSHYSLLDGMTKLDKMVSIAKDHGMGAIALTDHGNMYGAIEFYKLCKENGIKPIIGVEAYMTNGSRKERTTVSDGKRYYHLTLLAKNLTGYKHLMRLVTIANLEGYYYKPRMDKEILREYHEGIIALSGCMGGELAQTVLSGNLEKANEIIKEHQDIFGKENYFIEVQCHPSVPNDKKLRDALVALAQAHEILIVATQDSHYPCTDDHEAHHTLLQINTQSDIKDGGKFEFSSDDFSLIDEKTALSAFSDIPEAVTNCKLVADLCEDYEIELGKAYFPIFEIPDGKNSDEKLKELVYEGFKTRNIEKTEKRIERLEYELGIIKQKGYATYFLVVADLLRFAHEHGILTNIRGSVAGSLATYLLGVTNVDPFEYNLPFERFLNPDRPSLPDIDMDFADNRRDEVIQYTKQKYGEDRVAQVGTFGTMMAKGSVRDVARALGYPYIVGDKIASLIPLGSQGMPMTIDHAMELVPELREAYKKDPDTKRIIDLAKKIEGCVRHVSVHAAGIVIAPKPLYEFTPIQHDPKGGGIITQYDMYQIDDVGLPKFDFLGIRNLAILKDAVDLVRRLRAIEIDLEKIPIDDAKTFTLLAAGETEGLFQLNGSGMTSFLKQLKPTTIHDINAMVALYRPGPMQFIPQYIERKHKPRLVTYLDPALEPILERTFGILVYQDDLLEIARTIAGYTWGEVDKFRKAVGKKIPEEMAAQKEKFIKGCIEHSQWPEKKAQELWTWIEPFAAYGFNKAHAASYGRVAYQTAYMKANFPIEYMCAILSAESGDVEKVALIIEECKIMNIEVLPPDCNESFGGFTVIDNGVEKRSDGKTGVIRFGLYTIKNLGSDISDALIEERKNNGKFISIGDFLDRIKHKNLNKKSLEALIKSGAMDSLGDRGALFGNIENMLLYSKASNKKEDQLSLFGDAPEIFNASFRLDEVGAIDEKTRLSWEKELLGLYVSGHPLDFLRERIEKNGMSIAKLKDELSLGMPAVFAGIIEDVRFGFTKKNQKMAFVKVADYTGGIEFALFPDSVKSYESLLQKELIVAIRGRVSERNGERTVTVEGIKAL
jgi:DNA polymerase-3 subunit alpha